MALQYLTYPFKVMRITQGPSGSTSHKKYSTGNRKDYPVDEGGKDTGRDWMYAPVDLVVKRVYGYGNSKQPNTVWLETTKRVITPVGICYVCGRVTHMSDADIKGLKAGHVFKAGSKMFREYIDGGATGNHIHMTWGTGKFKGTGWATNNKGAAVLTTTGVNRNVNNIFFIDKSFTTILSSAGISFKSKPKKKTMYVNVGKSRLNVRKKWKLSAKAVGKLSDKTKVTVYTTRGKWSLIGRGKWVASKHLSTKK